MPLYMKLQKNKRKNYYNIIITKANAPLHIIEILGSLKIKKSNKVKFIKLNFNRVRFWLMAGILFSYESMKILIDLNLLPEPSLKD